MPAFRHTWTVFVRRQGEERATAYKYTGRCLVQQAGCRFAVEFNDGTTAQYTYPKSLSKPNGGHLGTFGPDNKADKDVSLTMPTFRLEAA